MGSPAQIDTTLKGSARLGGYLRRLRTGYGYSLRRVEQRARAEGGEIDNSQLSRYEKGLCYPSFDKLRVLASVFNVSVQSFSDVVDLETFEHLKPSTGTPEELVKSGIEALRRGDAGQAFAHYERATEILFAEAPSDARDEMIGSTRVHQAAALTRLGKLALAEQELRNALRNAERLSPALRAQAVLALANLHADQGETFLSELECTRAYDLATAQSLDRLAAMSLHTWANVLAAQGRYLQAVERAHDAARMYQECGERFEAIRVRMTTGSFYILMGKVNEGIRLLRQGLGEARAGSHRRLEAQAWSNLGEAYYRQNDRPRASKCFRESNALAIHNNEKYPDILFHTAFYEWKMAAEGDNPTRIKIALGRLKVLRSSLERRFAEVEEFDEYLEGGRSHA